MHAISSASPCHVRIERNDSLEFCDVVCWTLDDDGDPVPWIVQEGVKPVSAYDLPLRYNAVLRSGTAREAVEQGR